MECHGPSSVLIQHASGMIQWARCTPIIILSRTKQRHEDAQICHAIKLNLPHTWCLDKLVPCKMHCKLTIATGVNRLKPATNWGAMCPPAWTTTYISSTLFLPSIFYLFCLFYITEIFKQTQLPKYNYNSLHHLYIQEATIRN